jgi:SWI/SNF-related matrix-associated actin-dependent regulator 1 of chromatin subfamily A
MKPELYEISDDEWENHSFKPSRVLKRPRSPPPPLDSFAYKPPSQPQPQPVASDDDDDCVVISQITDNNNNNFECLDDLEDADVDDVEAAPTARPGRRFILDDEDEEDDLGGGDNVDVFDIDSTEDEVEVEIDEGNEGDLVGRALQKCARISVELKGELFGSSGAACERYSEVESSSVRIVTQVWFCKKMEFFFFVTLFSILILKCLCDFARMMLMLRVGLRIRIFNLC